MFVPCCYSSIAQGHKAIEDLEKRFCDLRKKWVEVKEKDIDFGHGKPWGDVEADEATFDKKNLGAEAPDPATPTQWEQWCGIVKRGCPKTLVLHRLSPALSAARAPNPGAIRGWMETIGWKQAAGPTHRCRQKLPHEATRRHPWQCRALQEESQGEGCLDMAASKVCSFGVSSYPRQQEDDDRKALSEPGASWRIGFFEWALQGRDGAPACQSAIRPIWVSQWRSLAVRRGIVHMAVEENLLARHMNTTILWICQQGEKESSGSSMYVYFLRLDMLGLCDLPLCLAMHQLAFQQDKQRYS